MNLKIFRSPLLVAAVLYSAVPIVLILGLLVSRQPDIAHGQYRGYPLSFVHVDNGLPCEPTKLVMPRDLLWGGNCGITVNNEALFADLLFWSAMAAFIFLIVFMSQHHSKQVAATLVVGMALFLGSNLLYSRSHFSSICQSVWGKNSSDVFEVPYGYPATMYSRSYSSASVNSQSTLCQNKYGAEEGGVSLKFGGIIMNTFLCMAAAFVLVRGYFAVHRFKRLHKSPT